MVTKPYANNELFKLKIKEQLNEIVHKGCMENIETPDFNYFKTKCKDKEIPHHTFFDSSDKQQMFNKEFSNEGTGLNLLLLIDEHNNYINLFSIQNEWTLQEILNEITRCKHFIFIDSSCSNQEYDTYSQDQLNTLGGKSKTKNKKQKTKTKNKKQKQKTKRIY
jgi:hypothetical protein